MDEKTNVDVAPEQAAEPQTEAPQAEAAQAEAPQAPSADLPAFDAGLEDKPAGAVLGAGAKGLEMLQDVSLEVTVELGRTRINLGEVMELGQGSVIELEKMAGEPVDIRVNGVLMASGEVIVLDDVFGVRITRLVNKGHRGGQD
jgi:flagellar motor switch protein FliN/FliY